MTRGLSDADVRRRAQDARSARQARKEQRVVAGARHILTLDPSLTLTQLSMDLGASNSIITQALRRQEDMTFNEFKRHLQTAEEAA